MHVYITNLIEQYDAKTDSQKSPALICDRTGFVEVPHLQGIVYVLSPTQILPASPHLTEQQVAELKVMWIGNRKVPDLYVGPQLDSDSVIVMLENYALYHQENFGTILAGIGYALMCIQRQTLMEAAIPVPSLHIVGDIATGRVLVYLINNIKLNQTNICLYCAIV
jgi:hypothetical protein